MWAAMTLAMMLPTAGPMILTYAEIADTAARKREPVVSPLVLTAGYVAVWLGFALVAASLQIGARARGPARRRQARPPLAGAIFLGAGLYQFSALKQRVPDAVPAAVSVLLRQLDRRSRAACCGSACGKGCYCLGCCWAMMLLMFAVGVMNVVWMAALGVVMTIEKMTTHGALQRARSAWLGRDRRSALIVASVV